MNCEHMARPKRNATSAQCFVTRCLNKGLRLLGISRLFPRLCFALRCCNIFRAVHTLRISLSLLILVGSLSPLQADNADTYRARVQPYIQKYCVACHNSDTAKGDLNLASVKSSSDVIAGFRRWNNVIEFIQAGEMPPEDAAQPSIEESNAVVENIRSILIAEARKQAGDPGPVPPRRLSNAEYDLSIRELTGIDIPATKDFPVDPAGGEGFDNTGEALGMSPNLLKKYLTAAQLVSDHLVLKPQGISFAPFPVTSYNERKKLTEDAIIGFYQSHDVSTLDYLEAAWRFRYRASDLQGIGIEAWAERLGLSPSYLQIVWRFLTAEPLQQEFQARFSQAWNSIPAPVDQSSQPAELLTLRDLIEMWRCILSMPEVQLIKANAGNWPISHLAFRTKVAGQRDQFDRANLKSETLLKVGPVRKPAEGNPSTVSLLIRIDPAFSSAGGYVVLSKAVFTKADQLPRNQEEEEKQQVQSLLSVLSEAHPSLVKTLAFGKHPAGGEVEPTAFVVKAPCTIEIPLTVELQRQLAGKNLLVQCALDSTHSRENSVLLQSSMNKLRNGSFSRDAQLLIFNDSETVRELASTASSFCNAFPNQFFYVDEGRGLAAGFHLVEGFFRDDQPLVNKVLSHKEKAHLDQLWQELAFVTRSTENLLRGFVWFERSEREVLHDKRFDFLNSEDPELIEDALLSKFEMLYLDKMQVKRIEGKLEPESPDEKFDMIHHFFEEIREGLRQQSELTIQAERLGLADIEKLARRAYRRDLREDDRESLKSLYNQLRKDGQDVEAALRGVLMAVLMSPDFLYLYRLPPSGDAVYPLSNHDLASRLSFLLWSSLPDEELLQAVARGNLQTEEELLKQTQRMLKDTRVASFAREFFGQWLRYRDYLSKDPINAAAFEGYDDKLRWAISEEPVRLATHLIQTDQSVTSLLNSDVTFVNQQLAKHYGGDIERQFNIQFARLHAEDKQAGPLATQKPDETWCLVDGLKSQGRGGLLGMAVVLAKNSAGDRTSPVKRGFWSVHHLLGQHFPPPPADVPELPKSEKEADHTIRELLAAHVEHQTCAMCHKHFDGLGLAMEGFDAIGRLRTTDLAGRPIDDKALLPNGETARGIPGLIGYIVQHRQTEFTRNLCRKFLGYALGRSVLLSDQLLLDEMEAELAKNEQRFSVLFDVVVRSPQFRQQRGRDFPMAGR